MNQHLHTVDLVIVAAYLAGITLFGLRFREKKSGGGGHAGRSLKSYFLADNTIPWWAIALSIVSAETSTLTIISVPGIAFAGDFGFLQLVIGYMLGRIVVALLFLPRYFRGEMMTAYQLIDRRFGPVLHKVTAGLFLLTRAAAEGVRVFAVSIVVGIAIGTGDMLSIGIISALTLLYTFEGGMAAVIWTDVVQMAIYVGGTFVALWSLGQHVPGGWAHIVAVAAPAGKFHMLSFAMNLTTTYTFWAGVLGGTFLTMASHGTDQLMVQRMLAARNLRESRLALLSSGVVIFMQFALFLLIGVGLWVFYGQHATFTSSDRIFPTFIVRELPIGIAGLLVAAILAAAMSNLSAALNSLSSTTVVDFYMRLRPQADDRERNMISKSSTVLWALVLFAIAIYSLRVGGKGHVVEIGLSIASVAYGCLLGVFLLGTLTKFATEIGATVGMVCGFALNLWLRQGNFPKTFLGGDVLHCVLSTNNAADNFSWAHCTTAGFTVPHVAFTWYVLIGAVVTFAVGALASLVFRKQSERMAAVGALVALVFCGGSYAGDAQQGAAAVSTSDFAPITKLLDDAIAAHKLPGAVVVVGHNGKVVFEQAYGARKLAGEPGLDGQPSPAEAMTEDTVFDMASLTKCLATATAVMQLYDAGKIASFDDPLEKYLPAFNTTHDPQRAKVTLRMLLTHTSGESPDVDLKDPWGLAHTDRAEGINRALTTPLKATPGSIFTYSDINFILLGILVEQLSGEREDDYAKKHIFQPLSMSETTYHPLYGYCGLQAFAPAPYGHDELAFKPAQCNMSATYPFTIKIFEKRRTAPTAHDNEGTAATNPNFDRLLRGTVHDPTTRRMGGVAGHAGVFSTAHDISLFAQALLDKLTRNAGPFPVSQVTLRLMTQPEQPGHTAKQLSDALAANVGSISKTDPLLAANYPAIKGQNLRGYGWDIDTGFSKPRGIGFSIGSFGHTGFTGTSLWMDPESNSYVILLANAIHPRGNAPISNLRGDVATAAAVALKIPLPVTGGVTPEETKTSTLTGIDVLEVTHFAALKDLHRIGLLTNQTGLDRDGQRTIDVLLANHQPLTVIFSPEHGINGSLDKEGIASTVDAATHLHVISLYGNKPADRHPTHEQLKELDAVVIDVQDAGVHFWTYEAAAGYFLEAAATEKLQYHHDLQIVVLDRPNPIGGVAVQGPVSDAGSESYVNYMPLPVRHGLTLGELMRYANATKRLNASLTVVPMQHWQRDEYFADTGVPWVNPSPNLRSPDAAILYPALGLIETTNVSVGRGTAHPFRFFGAPWMNAAEVTLVLNARHIPGVVFTSATERIEDNASVYPFHGETIAAVEMAVTDRAVFDSPEAGVEILSALHRLYPIVFHVERAKTLLCHAATLDALMQGEDPRTIASRWQLPTTAFRTASEPWRLYQNRP